MRRVSEAHRFTLDEANALIPRLEMLMERVQRAARTLRAEMQDDDPEGSATPPARSTADVLRARPDLAPHVHELESGVGEIERLGCQFKGLDLGLVDFPAVVDGTTVLLCWQYGEKQIAYWHRTDEGFGSRRPLGAAAIPQLQ
jgi:hypothetical protein